MVGWVLEIVTLALCGVPVSVPSCGCDRTGESIPFGRTFQCVGGAGKNIASHCPLDIDTHGIPSASDVECPRPGPLGAGIARVMATPKTSGGELKW